MKSTGSTLIQRVSTSIFPKPRDASSGKPDNRFLLRNLWLHFRPTTVPEPTLKFSLTWGLGGMAAVLVLIQLATGTLLKFVYAPSPALAYASIKALNVHVLFGKLIRNIHYWSANALVLVAFLHLLRTFFTGAFHGPRRFTWVIGLGLFCLILCANFTGYLLPWDQLAFWAVTICAGMLDYLPGLGSFLKEMIKTDPEIGAATLKIFYSFHTTVIPALIIIIMSFHFWRVRKAGGLVIPKFDENDAATPVNRVRTVPNLLLRELVVGLVLIAFILMLALFIDAPLDKPANPGLSPNPTKAPWYFAGLQELLLHFHPTLAAWVIPFLFMWTLLLLPYLNFERDPSGVWFISPRGLRSAGTAALLAIIATPLMVLLDEYLFDFNEWFAGIPSVVMNGVIPILMLVGLIVGYYMLTRKKKKSSGADNEAVQAVFVFLCVSFIVLTVVNIWFRGPAMALAWPWATVPLISN